MGNPRRADGRTLLRVADPRSGPRLCEAQQVESGNGLENLTQLWCADALRLVFDTARSGEVCAEYPEGIASFSPRLARWCLPWVTVSKREQPQSGCGKGRAADRTGMKHIESLEPMPRHSFSTYFPSLRVALVLNCEISRSSFRVCSARPIRRYLKTISVLPSSPMIIRA